MPSTFVALFRGLNVGGSNRLAMNELVAEFGNLGLHGAVTYIQSGNVAFRSSTRRTAELERRISGAIRQNHGFEPRVLVVRVQELEHAIAANPFPEAARDPETLHLWFLAEAPPAPDLEALERLKAAPERFSLDRKVFYVHAPEGIGRSKLAAGVEKHLGVDATSRNWRTVTRVLEMAWDLS